MRNATSRLLITGLVAALGAWGTACEGSSGGDADVGSELPTGSDADAQGDQGDGAVDVAPDVSSDEGSDLLPDLADAPDEASDDGGDLDGAEEDDGSGGCDAVLPADDAGTGTVWVVAPSCAGAGVADGSLQAPFATISEALAVAQSGDAVLVEAGTYPERLTIAQDGLRLIGSDPGAVAAQAGIILQSPTPEATVFVNGATDVLLRGVSVEGASVAGIWVHQGSATIEGSRVSGTKADSSGAFGFGVLATESKGIILQRNAIVGSASAGVLIQGGSASIILQDNGIDDNGRGGIRLEQVTGGGQVLDNRVRNNHEMGVGVLSSVGIILQRNVITGTLAGGPTNAADGVLIVEIFDGATSLGAPSATIGAEDADAPGAEQFANTIEDNGRVGVVVSGEMAGIILQRNAICANGRAGIWVQDDAGKSNGAVMIRANALEGNRFLGVALTRGARATVADNTIADTEGGVLIAPGGLDTISMGDGVGIFELAGGAVTGNVLTGNERAGMLGDRVAGADTTISGNTFASNALGSIILQHVAEGGASAPATPDVSPQTLPDAEALDTVPETAAGMGATAGLAAGP